MGVGMSTMLLLTSVKGIVVEGIVLTGYLLVVSFAVKRARRLEWYKKSHERLAASSVSSTQEQTKA